MNYYKLALALGGICLIAALILIFNGNISIAGPLIIIFFIGMAIGFRGFTFLKGFSYSMMIFAAVTTALNFPHYFIKVEGFKLTTLITPLIQLIMFGMGTKMGLKDFAGVVKMPKAVFIGLTGHYTVMPLIGFALA